jgi:hypothetical protein
MIDNDLKIKLIDKIKEVSSDIEMLSIDLDLAAESLEQGDDPKIVDVLDALDEIESSFDFVRSLNDIRKLAESDV